MGIISPTVRVLKTKNDSLVSDALCSRLYGYFLPLSYEHWTDACSALVLALSLMHTKWDALRNQRVAWFCRLQMHACIHMCIYIYICISEHTSVCSINFLCSWPVELATFVHILEEKQPILVSLPPEELGNGTRPLVQAGMWAHNACFPAAHYREMTELVCVMSVACLEAARALCLLEELCSWVICLRKGLAQCKVWCLCLGVWEAVLCLCIIGPV